MAERKKTGGRTKGVPNRATAAKAAEIAASGVTPLDYMLSILRDDLMSTESRFEAAKAAAPYVHPKLASVEHKGDPENPVAFTRVERVIVDPSADTVPTDQDA